MQIGIRLHDTKKGTLEERVAIAEEQGFSCAHLALKKVIGAGCRRPVDEPFRAAYPGGEKR